MFINLWYYNYMYEMNYGVRFVARSEAEEKRKLGDWGQKLYALSIFVLASINLLILQVIAARSKYL